MRPVLLGWRWVVVAGLITASMSCGDGSTEPTPVCSYAISPAARGFGDAGGAGSVTVTTAAGCSWSATASASWITIAMGPSGSGSATIGYSVAANGETGSRSGSLTIAGQTHTVNQEGRPAPVCTYTIAPSGATFSKDEATGSFGVTAPAGCAWSPVSGASWITITSGQGSGDGTVTYAITRNTAVADRDGTIAVGDRTFTIRQIGDAPAPVCEYSVAPVELRPCMASGTVTASVATSSRCAWTVAPDASWLGVSGSTARTGSGAITITYADNYDAPRQGVVKVRWDTPTAGQNILVYQAGCSYSVTPNAFTIPAGGGSGTFTVYQMADPNSCGGPLQDRCVWSAVSDATWITIAGSMPRSGDNPVSFSIAANPGIARTGRITVRDKVVVITQAAQ
jgi:hypothetical protein